MGNFVSASSKSLNVLILLGELRLDSLVKMTFKKINEKFGLNIEVVSILDINQVELNSQVGQTLFVTDEKNYNAFKKENRNEKFLETLLVGDKKVNEPIYDECDNVTYLEKEKIFTEMTNIFNDKILPYLVLDNYVSVQIKNLNPNLSYPNDFYIKINDKKFIKIVRVNEVLGEDVINKFYQKHDIFFYIPEDQYNSFVNFQFKRKDLSTKSLIDNEFNVIADLHKCLKDVGFSEALVSRSKQSLSELHQKFNNDKKVSSLLTKFQVLEGSYLYSHSYLASLIAFSCKRYFDWLNLENLEKIHLGCLFHDLGYQDEKNCVHEHLTLSELKELRPEVSQDVLGHTHALEKFLQDSKLHDDIIKMVTSHHGVHGEESYPQKTYGTEINLNFALFVLVHETAVFLIKNGINQKTVEESLSLLNEKFNNGQYRKLLPKFKEAMINSFNFK